MKTVSSTQSTVALSSPESEYYGVVKGGSLSIGLRALMRDFGLDHNITVYTDNDSGASLGRRRGLGRARHIETRFLWLQEKVGDKTINLARVPGKKNPADIGTKHVPAKNIQDCLERLCIRRTDEILPGALKS